MLANALKPLVKLFAPGTAAPPDPKAQWRETILHTPVGKFVYVGASGNDLPLKTASQAPSMKVTRPSAYAVLKHMARTIQEQQPDPGSDRAARAQALIKHLCSLQRQDLIAGKSPCDYLKVTAELQEAVKNAL